jgi:hypothetical protein
LCDYSPRSLVYMVDMCVQLCSQLDTAHDGP